MKDMRDLITTLRDLERELHESSVRTSGRVAELLADSFVEFGCSGKTYSKAEVISALLAEPATTISATDFKLHQISPDVALPETGVRVDFLPDIEVETGVRVDFSDGRPNNRALTPV